MGWNLTLIKYLSKYFIFWFERKYNLGNIHKLTLMNEKDFLGLDTQKIDERQFSCTDVHYAYIYLCYERLNKFDIRNLYELYFFIGATMLHEILHTVYKDKFEDEKEEEIFILSQTQQQYPKYYKIFENIYNYRKFGWLK